MAGRKRRLFKILGWIVLSFFSLILLTTLGFYLGRGWIMNRAVNYINENQPGEVQMGQMNLIPFMNFPDVSLQLRNMNYYENALHPDSLYQEPILSLSEVYITLDVLDLIRKNIQVSEARMANGFIRIERYEDSITNLEKALGRRISDFGNENGLGNEESGDLGQGLEKSSGLPFIQVNLDQINLTNTMLILNDQAGDKHVQLRVNELESSFSYLPEEVLASIELNIDFISVKYLTYRDETERNIQFNSVVIMQPLPKTIQVEPSTLKVSGLELETWGSYDFFDIPEVNFEFIARNEGLELLNYIFRGILDLDEIEQIGDGSINLSGNVSGLLEGSLPVVNVSGSADQIGFRIKSIGKDVSGISFKVNASNGSKLDFSEGFVSVEAFSANFPEGTVSGNMSAVNLISPELKVELHGEVNLFGMEKILDTDLISDLEGSVRIHGDIMGALDREKGQFLNSQGFIKAQMENVGFLFSADSLKTDSIKYLKGELILEQNLLCAQNMEGEYNGNRLRMNLQTENLLLSLMGFDTDVKAELTASADVLKVASLIRDSAVSNLLGQELTGMHFKAGAEIKSKELKKFLMNRSLPELELSLDSFDLDLPTYSDISNMKASLSIGSDTLKFNYLNGMVGESEFEFSGHLAHLGALTGFDSAEVVSLGFQISSELMRAEDFFTLNDEFLLPLTYHSEYLEDFHLGGSVDLPTEALKNDSLSLDFALNIWDLGWNFRYYPLTFENFEMQINREGERLLIKDFQGSVGESNLKMQASLENFRDTLVENLRGEMVLESHLLDFNKLMNYQVPQELAEGLTEASLAGSGKVLVDSGMGVAKEPPRLDQIKYPNFNFTVDIGELRYGGYNFFDLEGQLRSSKNKIFYLDQLSISGKSGGSMAFHGQFNVANPYMYTFSAEMDMQDMNIDDLDIDMQTGDTIYTLKENFDGIVSADGMAEIFITPDLKVDMSSTTAIFNVRIEDGALINFSPLKVAAKYLDNKDLNYVTFATLQNSFPLTLIDSKIIVPLMNVESSLGQMLIEGEQGLDKSFLYLLRIPPNLARAAAKSVLIDGREKQEEDHIQEMKRGNFYNMTVWSNGVDSDFKLGDKRSKFQE